MVIRRLELGRGILKPLFKRKKDLNGIERNAITFFKDRYLKCLINEQKNSRSIINLFKNIVKEQVIVNI